MLSHLDLTLIGTYLLASPWLTCMERCYDIYQKCLFCWSFVTSLGFHLSVLSVNAIFISHPQPHLVLWFYALVLHF